MSRRRNSKRQSGHSGEYAVANSIQRVLGHLPYRLYNDVYFEDAEGLPFQIDHLVLTPMGLLVVETKNWNGIVYGQPSEMQWSFVPHGKGKIHQLYNPVLQNERHVAKLRSVLGDTLPMTPCVVFAHPFGELQIGLGMTDRVFTRAWFEAFLAQWMRRSPILDECEMEVWHQKITAARRVDEEMIGRQRNYARELRRLRKARKGAIGYAD